MCPKCYTLLHEDIHQFVVEAVLKLFRDLKKLRIVITFENFSAIELFLKNLTLDARLMIKAI